MYAFDRDGPFTDLMADPQAWVEWSPRDEIRPAFRRAIDGGPGGRPALVLSGTGNPDVCGCFRLPLPGLTVGRTYAVEVLFASEALPDPGKSILAVLTVPGTDRQERVFYDHLDYAGRETGWHRVVTAFEVSGPPADFALEVFLAWSPSGSVKWADGRLYDVTDDPQPGRKVRLAAVSGGPERPASPAECIAFYTDRIAGLTDADLVCLPELINVVGLQHPGQELAEPVPGPTSQTLAEAARQAGCYVGASILERDGGSIRNTGILLDRTGGLVGKYRKTHLPAGEGHLGGVTPGNDYPLFSTDFGTVGYMICYDGHYPEVARCLALGGAEVILLSNTGDGREGGSLWEPFVRTRALDNQVHILAAVNEGRSCVVSPKGEVLSMSDQTPGAIASAECDLNASVADFTGRPIRRRYDHLRRSSTFQALTRHLWDA